MTYEPPPHHDGGLEHDVRTLVSRRRTLGILLGAGAGAAAALAGCAPAPTGSSRPAPGTASATATTTGSAGQVTSAPAECGAEIPDETAGPYPGDGSNGPDVLAASGIVRSDIRSSFGTASGTVTGIPLTVTLTLLDASDGCRPLEGAAVYLWHCDPTGNYSLYSAGHENENWLRGVQEADGNGQLTFTTVFPGAYPGRYPHLHFEVFESLSRTTSSGQLLKVSQLALPSTACDAVYVQSLYGSSAAHHARTPLTGDTVFGDDGGTHQLGTATGSVQEGYAVSLNVTVA